MSETRGRAIGRATALGERPSTGYRILIVDDDAAIRGLVARVLRAAGHDVVVATDGRAALRTALGDSMRFELLLTDVEMPGMTGIELAARLRAARPSLPVVLMSGEESIVEAARGRADLVRAAIHKPFSALELLEAVERCLAESGERNG
jgi:CheY-like chemotaxis protein